MKSIKNIREWSLGKKILFVPILLVAFCLIGYLFLVAVFYIPLSGIDENVGNAAWIFGREGSYPVTMSYYSSVQDNYTDALMLLTATNPVENPWKSAVMVPHYDGQPRDVLVSI